VQFGIQKVRRCRVYLILFHQGYNDHFAEFMEVQEESMEVQEEGIDLYEQ